MSDSVLADLMLEQFRAIRAQMSRVQDDISGMKVELRAINDHLTGFMRTLSAHSEQIASLDARLDRIERRLDLVETEPR